VSRCGVTLLAGDREAELLPVPYFHVVYTLPSELRDIAYQNKGVVYNLLMKAAAETTLASDPKLLGARIGVTAVLHLFPASKNQHIIGLMQRNKRVLSTGEHAWRMGWRP
jgi:hypothetical protein